MWLCGYVAMWLYGYVVMWPCGSVSQIQISKFQRSKKLGAHIPKFSKFWSVTFPKIICFQDVPIYFLPPSPLLTRSPPHPPRLLVDLQRIKCVVHIHVHMYIYIYIYIYLFIYRTLMGINRRKRPQSGNRFRFRHSVKCVF